MSANITDYFSKASSMNGNYPVVATVSSARAAGEPILSCDSLAGWATDTPVHFSTFKIGTDGNIDTTTQTDWKGIVVGNSITEMTRIAGADDSGNASGDRVELNPTIGWLNDLIVGLLASHNQNGTLKNGAVSASALANSSITATKIANNAVETAKISDEAITTTKIASSAVTTDKIVDAGITTSKIASSAITLDKIDFTSMETVLYADSAGPAGGISSGNITLSDTIDNYDEVKLYWRTMYEYSQGVAQAVVRKNGTTSCSCAGVYVGNNGGALGANLKVAMVNISGRTCALSGQIEFDMLNNSYLTGQKVFIYKVIGVKKASTI